MPLTPEQRRALLEVCVIGAGYIAISLAVVRAIDVSALMPVGWTKLESNAGGTFLIGAIVQTLLVLSGAYVLQNPDFRRAIAAMGARSNRHGWTVALAAATIHIATGIILFLPEPQRVLEISSLNLLLSAISGVDGWSQEVIFRGYVLFSPRSCPPPGHRPDPPVRSVVLRYSHRLYR